MIKSSSFTKNESKLGGVIQAIIKAKLTIESCTFSKNRATESAAAIFVSQGATFEIKDCKFY